MSIPDFRFGHRAVYSGLTILANKHFWQPFSYGRKELATYCGFANHKAFMEYLNDIVSAGLVQVLEQKGGHNQYAIIDYSQGQPDPKKHPTRKTTRPEKRYDTRPEKQPDPDPKNGTGNDFTPYSMKTEDNKDLYNGANFNLTAGFDPYEELPLLPLDEGQTETQNQTKSLAAVPEQKTEKKLRKKKKETLLTETPYQDFETLKIDFLQTYADTIKRNPDTYAKADLQFYHEQLITWAIAGNHKRANWLQTFFTFLSNANEKDRLRITGERASSYYTNQAERRLAEIRDRAEAHSWAYDA